MEQPHETWRDQCAAAMTIQEKYGIEKAVGFLVGGALPPRGDPQSLRAWRVTS